MVTILGTTYLKKKKIEIAKNRNEINRNINVIIYCLSFDVVY